MSPPGENRELFLRYALEEMAAEERERIEDALVSDPDFFAAFQEAEHDLLDGYSAGDLSDVDRARVKKLLESTAALAEKARLSDALQRAAEAPVPALQSARNRVFVFRIPVLAFAAAVLLVAVFAASVLWRRSRLEGTARVPAPQPAASAPQSTPTRPQPVVPATLAILLPATARSAGPALSIQLTPQIGTVDVQWVLPDPSEAKSVLELRVWNGPHSVTHVRADRFEHVGAEVVAHFLLPAAELAAGGYLFQVNLRSAAGAGEEPELETAVTVKRTP
ncbi:MAG: hypothetical protein WAN28_06660 [Terracidiphilus sp.]